MREKDDFYASPEGVIDSLLDFYHPKGTIWECAAGDGALVDQMRRHGLPVIGTDLVNRGRGDVQYGIDFLMEYKLLGSHVVTNPPYKLAEKFVRHALDLGAVSCAMLLRLQWFGAKSRADLMQHLDKIVILGRLSMLAPDVEDKGMNGMVDFAWFVFTREKIPKTMIRHAIKNPPV